MIRRCLILDTESTGLDSEKNGTIELGAILYSVINRTILFQFSSLLILKEGMTVEPQAMEVNRIPLESLDEMQFFFEGHGNQFALDILHWMYKASDVAVAHNVEHDKGFLQQVGWMDFDDFIDTASDFTWPKNTSRSPDRLTQIAIAYGIPVVDPHRALDDCKLIASLFDKRDDLQEAFELAMRPRELYVANVSYDDRDKAKQQGFTWNKPVPRHWSRRLTQEEADVMPFNVSKVVVTE